MNKKTSSFFLLLIIFFSLIVSAKAQDYGEFWSIEYLWSQVLGLPQEWLQAREFIFNFLVPFLALYVILLGILRQLKIFWRTPAIEVVVAFAMAFMTLPSRIFITFVSITLGAAGIWGYLMFLLMFFGGSLFYSWGFVRRRQALANIYSGYQKGAKGLENELHNIRIQMAKIQQEMLQQPAGTDLTPYINKIEKLRKQEEDIINKLNALKLTLKAQV
ncbi:MAG: hypothetical protein ACP5O8_02095 [Candidatus Aenigmatarchaeota archaeon]